MFNEFSDNKTIKESLEFLEGCELENCGHSFHTQPRVGAFNVDKRDDESLVISDTITSIAAGMSRANKQTVKDILLFATLAANSIDPEGGDKWYQRYRDVLSYCGWGTRQWAVRRHQSSNSRFTMDQVALDILDLAIKAAALPGPTKLLLINAARETIAELKKSEKPLRLFENSSNQVTGAKFAIASCVESDDGEVAMAMGAVSFTTRVNVTNVLFWEWNSSSVNIKAAESNMFLNDRHYQGVRALVEKRLDEEARKAIENIDF